MHELEHLPRRNDVSTKAGREGMPSALHKEGKLLPTGSKAVTQPRLPSSPQLLLRVTFAILSGEPLSGV